jgi:hypothetical protein
MKSENKQALFLWLQKRNIVATLPESSCNFCPLGPRSHTHTHTIIFELPKTLTNPKDETYSNFQG